MTETPPPSQAISARSTALICAAVLAVASVVRIIPALGDFWLDEIWTYFSVRSLDTASGVFTQIHHSTTIT